MSHEPVIACRGSVFAHRVESAVNCGSGFGRAAAWGIDELPPTLDAEPPESQRSRAGGLVSSFTRAPYAKARWKFSCLFDDRCHQPLARLAPVGAAGWTHGGPPLGIP